MISVEDITVTGSSGSSDSKIVLLRGLLTRAMHLALVFFLAISVTTRLSSSSPVSATTTSARAMPASSSTSGSQPSPTIVTL